MKLIEKKCECCDALREEIRNEVLEEAAKVADEQSRDFDTLLARGNGEHGSLGYVMDASWYRWEGRASEAQFIAAAIRALKSPPPNEQW